MRDPAPHLQYEITLWQHGITHIAGLDEAGRGALAGPVAAGAVIFPPQSDIHLLLSGVRDSKQMTPIQRYKWAVEIKRACLAWSVGLATSAEIDSLGILPATRLAMQRALDQLLPAPEYLLIDSLCLRENPLPQCALIKGDQISLTIASASVLAKTMRDDLMREYAVTYPGYDFDRHKGYGTKHHLTALSTIGATPLHRFTFSPLTNVAMNSHFQ